VRLLGVTDRRGHGAVGGVLLGAIDALGVRPIKKVVEEMKLPPARDPLVSRTKMFLDGLRRRKLGGDVTLA
jgi:hypothetical protein